MEDHEDDPISSDVRAAPTGSAPPTERFAGLMAQLDDVRDRPVEEHREAFEQIHQQLVETLDELNGR